LHKKSIIKAMVILLAAAMLPALLSAETYAATAKAELNGNFVVELWDGEKYIKKAEFCADEFQKEFYTDLGNVTNPKIRISKEAEGLAFLDSLLLDGRAASENKKLQKTDFDVTEVTSKGIVIDFTGRFEGKLSFTGRIEPKVIEGEPFMFPFDNTFIDDVQKFEFFFEYMLNSNIKTVQTDGKYENQGEPFTIRYLMPTTGHPGGYAYIYVSNDDKYLYASADFTSDNTFDYGEDFFKLYTKINGIVKEFKQTSDGAEYGAASMQYTDKADYEHMYYEMRVPLNELGEEENLQLAFSLYGTAAASAYVISEPAVINMYKGQTANGKLRIQTKWADLLTGIDFNTTGLDVSFQIPSSTYVGDEGYTDISYTVQADNAGNHVILITGIETDNYYFSAYTEIPVNVSDGVNITKHPADKTVIQGQDATFSVEAASTAPPLSYQWEKSADNGNTWTDIAGATTSTLVLNDVKMAYNGTKYRCTVNNTANMSVVSNAATLTVKAPITGLPSNYTMYTGGRVTWDPAPKGGAWSWDDDYFSKSGGDRATFMALQAGKTTVTYTADGVSHSIAVTILKSKLPQTGQNFTAVWIILAVSALSALTVLIIKKRAKLSGVKKIV